MQRDRAVLRERGRDRLHLSQILALDRVTIQHRLAECQTPIFNRRNDMYRIQILTLFKHGRDLIQPIVCRIQEDHIGLVGDDQFRKQCFIAFGPLVDEDDLLLDCSFGLLRQIGRGIHGDLVRARITRRRCHDVATTICRGNGLLRDGVKQQPIFQLLMQCILDLRSGWVVANVAHLTTHESAVCRLARSLASNDSPLSRRVRQNVPPRKNDLATQGQRRVPIRQRWNIAKHKYEGLPVHF